MNHFQFHIGDYTEATLHLTFVEDAAYCRLLRKYYASEKPLPPEVGEVQRLIGARKAEEKRAVETILKEFFILAADGWRQRRADAEIENYVSGAPEREAKKANEKTRLQNHREERARLFSLLNAAGKHAEYNMPIARLREFVAALSQKPETENETFHETKTETPETLPATALATPATATHNPIPNTSTNIKDKDTPASPAEGDSSPPAFRLSAYPLPDWMPKAGWTDFCTMRRGLRKPLSTERAVKGVLADMEALIADGWSAEQLLTAAVKGSWLTFYEPKNQARANGSKKLQVVL